MRAETYWLIAGKTLSPSHIPNLSSHMNWARTFNVAAGPRLASGNAGNSGLHLSPPCPLLRAKAWGEAMRWGVNAWCGFNKCEDWKGSGNYLTLELRKVVNKFLKSNKNSDVRSPKLNSRIYPLQFVLGTISSTSFNLHSHRLGDCDYPHFPQERKMRHKSVNLPKVPRQTDGEAKIQPGVVLE